MLAAIVPGQVERWRDALNLSGLKGPCLELDLPTGSLELVEPYRSRYSSNPEIPKEISKIVEIDLALELPEATDILDHKLLRTLNEVFGYQSCQKVDTRRWGKPYTALFLYSYEKIEGDLWREYHISVFECAPLPLTPYWEQAFSDSELKKLRELRQVIRNQSDASNAEYFELKGLQALECRWRVVSSLGIQALMSSNHPLSEQFGFDLLDFPRISAVPELKGVVTSWTDGQLTGECLERPLNLVPVTLLPVLKELGYRDLCFTDDPDWVSTAMRVQELLAIHK